jgi:murein DD-endopeptidase MepM/ murein hydrolase activator NlpD
VIQHARPLASAALCGLLVVSAAAAPPAKPPASAPQRVHEVTRGDTLFTLARRYNVSVAALVSANRLPSDRVTLRLRQRLVIPPPESGTDKPAAPRTDKPAPRSDKPAAPTRADKPAAPVRSDKPAALARAGRPGRDASPRSAAMRAPADFFFAVPDFADALTPFVWPKEGTITSPFGRRRLGWHRGVDIKGDRGEPIIAAAPGVVVVSGVEPRYGRVVKIEHEYGFTTVYAHNDGNHVEVGDWVVTGQRIASVGRTGRATSYHLHFEIRRDGRVYNPLYMLPLPARIAHVTETGEEEGDE